jgi:hypothetical protein
MSESDGDEAEGIIALAEFLGVALRAEHVAEVLRSWRLMAPHRERVQAMDLEPTAEPAALLRL